MKTINEWSQHWFFTIGANIIPADTKHKKVVVPWAQYQDEPIDFDQYGRWFHGGAFALGTAILAGKLWRGNYEGKYLIFIDLDNQKAIDEFCAVVGAKDLQTISQKWIVEQHPDDKSKAHIYVITPFPFPKKSSDSPDPEVWKRVQAGEFPALEVKGEGKHGIAYCTPSPHKGGTNYEVIGTNDPVPLEQQEAEELLEKINSICVKYGIKYLDGSSRKKKGAIELFAPEYKVPEGHNRHEALLRAMEALIVRNRKIMDEETIKLLARRWNEQHCAPPLPDDEFEKQWKCATQFISKKADLESEPDPIRGDKIHRKITAADTFDRVTVEAKVHAVDDMNQGIKMDLWKCTRCDNPYEDEREKCSVRGCGGKVKRIVDKETLEDQRWIELTLYKSSDHQHDTGDILDRKKSAILRGDLAQAPIELSGDYRIQGIVKPKLLDKAENTYIQYLDVEEIIATTTKEEQVFVTDDDEKTFRDHADKCPECIIPELVEAFAPHIYGQDLVKESILYQMVGGNYSGSSTRGDIHVLLIGDPSEGKTELGLAASRIAGGEFASGEALSAAGIGAGMVKDPISGRWVAEGGIAVVGNRRLKVLDEIDKMNREFLNQLLTIMDKGFFKLDKIKHMEFETKGAWLCLGNPKGGKYNPILSLAKNIDFPTPVLTRFDLIYILKKTHDPDITRKKLERINKQYQGQLITKVDEQHIKKWMQLAKKQTSITIEPEVFEILTQFYHSLEQSGRGDQSIPITERQYHGMLRMAIARAKLHLRNRVVAADAHRAVEIMTAMMKMVGIEVVNGTVATIAKEEKDKSRTFKKVLESLTVGKTELESVKEDDIVKKMIEFPEWAGQDEARNYIRSQQMEGKIWSPRTGWWAVQ